MKLKTLKRGFTLVELMIVVAIIGVLAALAIYGVRKYLNNAKTAEAKSNIGHFSQQASAAFAKPKMANGLLAANEAAAYANTLCATVENPVPNAIPAGEKIQPSATDWEGTQTPTVGWYCLDVMIETPVMYQYNYQATAPLDALGGTFFVEANGDLDGDGVPSRFFRSGDLFDDGGQLVIRLAPSIEETDPEE